MSERPRQTNCQNEPPYPGRATCVFSLRFPNLTIHHATVRCAVEHPHPTAECGEWAEKRIPLQRI